jgi:hypothetical protein
VRILAIDPGTKQSGVVLYDSDTRSVVMSGVHPNEDVLELFILDARERANTSLAIEMIGNYGMAVGKTTFETCVWIGRFIQAWCESDNDIDTSEIFVYRSEVKMHLCNSVRAKDKNIRQAMIDMFPPTGGGKTPQVGTKGKRGPLYGVKSHAWSALAIALTYVAREQL